MALIRAEGDRVAGGKLVRVHFQLKLAMLAVHADDIPVAHTRQRAAIGRFGADMDG